MRFEECTRSRLNPLEVGSWCQTLVPVEGPDKNIMNIGSQSPWSRVMVSNSIYSYIDYRRWWWTESQSPWSRVMVSNSSTCDGNREISHFHVSIPLKSGHGVKLEIMERFIEVNKFRLSQSPWSRVMVSNCPNCHFGYHILSLVLDMSQSPWSRVMVSNNKVFNTLAFEPKYEGQEGLNPLEVGSWCQTKEIRFNVGECRRRDVSIPLKSGHGVKQS